jgi:hypothetical protein
MTTSFATDSMLEYDRGRTAVPLNPTSPYAKPYQEGFAQRAQMQHVCTPLQNMPSRPSHAMRQTLADGHDRYEHARQSAQSAAYEDDYARPRFADMYSDPYAATRPAVAPLEVRASFGDEECLTVAQMSQKLVAQQTAQPGLAASAVRPEQPEPARLRHSRSHSKPRAAASLDTTAATAASADATATGVDASLRKLQQMQQAQAGLLKTIEQKVQQQQQAITAIDSLQDKVDMHTEVLENHRDEIRGTRSKLKQHESVMLEHGKQITPLKRSVLSVKQDVSGVVREMSAQQTAMASQHNTLSREVSRIKESFRGGSAPTLARDKHQPLAAPAPQVLQSKPVAATYTAFRELQARYKV